MGEKVKVEVKIDKDGDVCWVVDGMHHVWHDSIHNQEAAELFVEARVAGGAMTIYLWDDEDIEHLALSDSAVVATYEVEL